MSASSETRRLDRGSRFPAPGGVLSTVVARTRPHVHKTPVNAPPTTSQTMLTPVPPAPLGPVRTRALAIAPATHCVQRYSEGSGVRCAQLMQRRLQRRRFLPCRPGCQVQTLRSQGDERATHTEPWKKWPWRELTTPAFSTSALAGASRRRFVRFRRSWPLLPLASSRWAAECQTPPSSHSLAWPSPFRTGSSSGCRKRP